MSVLPRVVMVVVVFAACHITSVVWASVESDANSAEIKVYPSSDSDWTSSVETAFKTAVASQATTYCSSSLSSCGLDSAVTFTASDVTTHGKTESSRSLQLSVYISYPAGANITSGGSTSAVIPLTALKEILEDARDSVKSSSADVYITWIASDYYGIPPTSTTNGIIIPVGFLTVIVIGISAAVMVYYQEREEKNAKRAAHLAKRKASKAQPNYDIKEDLFISNGSKGATTSNVPAGVVLDNSMADNGKKMTTMTNATQQTKKSAKISPMTPDTSPRYVETNEQSVNYFHANGGSRNHNNPFDPKSTILPPLPSSNSIVINTDTATNQHEQDLDQDTQGETEHEREERRRRRKEKKEKKRLHELKKQHRVGFEVHENGAFDSSAVSASEAGEVDHIPTFTVKKEGGV